MNGTGGRAPTFAMFCTMADDAFWIAEVADEIEAVRAYSLHIAECGEDHKPYVHMEPMRDEWQNDDADFADLDPARNLFRVPAERV